jgi:hypothetical protein
VEFKSEFLRPERDGTAFLTSRVQPAVRHVIRVVLNIAWK